MHKTSPLDPILSQLHQIRFLNHISATAILVLSFFLRLALPVVSFLHFSIQYEYILNSLTIRIYIYIYIYIYIGKGKIHP